MDGRKYSIITITDHEFALLDERMNFIWVGSKFIEFQNLQNGYKLIGWIRYFGYCLQNW